MTNLSIKSSISYEEYLEGYKNLEELFNSKKSARKIKFIQKDINEIAQKIDTNVAKKLGLK